MPLGSMESIRDASVQLFYALLVTVGMHETAPRAD